MANKTISDLNELTTVSNSDVLLVETNTETSKVTKENLLKEVKEQLNTKSNVGHTHTASEITDLQERWDYDSDSNAILVRGGSDVWTYDQQNDSIIVS